MVEAALFVESEGVFWDDDEPFEELQAKAANRTIPTRNIRRVFSLSADFVANMARISCSDVHEFHSGLGATEKWAFSCQNNGLSR